MASIEEIRKERLQKLEMLREQGMDPYPSDVERTHSLAEVRASFDALAGKEPVAVVGRIMARRGQGAISFVDLDDGTDRFQAVFKKDTVAEYFDLFLEAVDIGDHILVKGVPFATERGEQSIAVERWQILSKSLRPLPEKWHGLQDPEARFRQRYLDLLLNSDLRQMFERKAHFWQVVRSFLAEEKMLEVETPTLEHTTGGAEARPFQTHHNDFDIDVFLRISVGELWQKRLMAAGFSRVFEIGRVYRNEGTSPEHVQEFTNAEFYAAYMNFDDGKELIKRLYRRIADEVYGTTQFEKGEYSFDLADEWEEIDYVDTVKEKTGIDVLTATDEEMRSKLEELDQMYEGDTRERMIDTLWKYCRKQIAGPVFLTGHPLIVAPLSKTDPENPEKTKTLQIIIAGSEIGRAHAELNDPIEQRKRFEIQQGLLEKGDEEAMMPDWEYVEAMEYAFPPTFGFGFGDRLFAYLENKPIRETQLFPLLRPKDSHQ
ncbi:MAG: lysine--tRNA ligase [Candidatus Paceibacterota bacterium]